MIREHLNAVVVPEADFRWRAHESTRLEGFSDAVFAFAVTLLVVSLEVPKSFQDLLRAMRGFIAFGVCFAILAFLWHSHYRFFRRYALQTTTAVFLNSVMLFFLLFYVYPLKFLFGLVFSADEVIDPNDARMLFVIYGTGYAALSLVFALLYRHAYSLRDALQLSQVEKLMTRHELINHVAQVLVGVISVGLAMALPARLVGLTGYFYFTIGIYYTITGPLFGRQVRSLKALQNP